VNRLFKEWQQLHQSSLARNASWLLAGQGTGVLLQALYFVVLARLLGAVKYGIFAGAFAFTGIVATYSTLGTGTVLLRYVTGNYKQFAVYWGNLLLVTAVLGSSLIVVLHIIAPHLLNPASAALVLLAAIANCFCAQLTVETSRVFQAFEQMRTVAALSLLTNLMRTLTAMGMLIILHRATAWQWAVASTAVSAFAAIFAIVIVTKCFGFPHFKPHLFVKHGLEGFGYSFASSTASVYNDIDKTMLSHYGMNMANGIYTMAYRVIDIATMPIYSIREAAAPQFFQRGRSGLKPVAELSRRLLKRAFPVSLLAAVVLFVAAPIITLIAGNGFAESVTALRWLCLIPVFRSVHNFTGSALMGAGLQTYRTVGQLIAASLNFGLNLYLIPHYGWLGAAWSSLATDAALGGLNWGMLYILVRKGK
jgi:O-antigen/teichoic acid export membrane protein